MPTEHSYTGPAVDRGRDKDKILIRHRHLVHRLARRIHATEVLHWAGADEVPYPSPGDALREAAFEIETLIRGLGEWAAVDPGLWDTVREDARLEVAAEPGRRNPWAATSRLWDPDEWDWP